MVGSQVLSLKVVGSNHANFIFLIEFKRANHANFIFLIEFKRAGFELTNELGSTLQFKCIRARVEFEHVKNIRVEFEHVCSKLVRYRVEFERTSNYSSRARHKSSSARSLAHPYIGLIYSNFINGFLFIFNFSIA